MKVKHLIYALIIIVLGAFITYRIVSNKSKNDESKKSGDKDAPTTVTGIVVKTSTFDNNLSLSGSIEANEQIEIHSEVSGIVEGIYFNEGTNVSKGQVLFKVNDIELRAQLRQAVTKENLAGENERRAKLLLQKEAISQEEFDVANADYASAKAQSQLIKAQIEKTSVRAPFSGKIGLRSISPGTYITPTIVVAKLVNSGKLKITFSIPEKYASEVRSGSTIEFAVSGSTKSYSAKIYAIEPEVAIATRTLQIRAIADNLDGKLFPGTFADVKLPLNIIKDAIVVPSESIIPVQAGKKVYIANMGKAKEVMVDATTRTDASILILSGLKAGDTLITSGVMSLKNDAPIKVKVK
ncbi:efflux RND transporter periplasmic adaptor subunit [Flavobacterium sp. MC2016-06]|uniref:efflux RND transporter periplasmic adaptor subunit n=1 Tax=Flavobacterium sp. MC2016-06 TaxID=2676308 RepID=UPI0012BA5788|nr:efflux RND transporter periplasmic adaptor subunit [Flavobacterium sp. MC2016-06]MBU3857796.1 efflux RND transporter periplasmic adaptor subunit [Flavobacterium sp. MC2016-06]